MKLLIIGNAGHGKDELGRIIMDNSALTYTSSSYFALELFLWGKLKGRYKTLDEAYADGNNHREFWFSEILKFNQPDYSRLAEKLLLNYDVYVGMRSRLEFESAMKKKLFDLVIWVDATKRIKEEPASSMPLTANDADIIINNNGTKDELNRRVIRLLNLLIQGDNHV